MKKRAQSNRSARKERERVQKVDEGELSNWMKEQAWIGNRMGNRSFSQNETAAKAINTADHSSRFNVICFVFISSTWYVVVIVEFVLTSITIKNCHFIIKNEETFQVDLHRIHLNKCNRTRSV